jgi:antitoxin (DNA-binding transcriptional repressor) of toxin-antitoxin stability system
MIANIRKLRTSTKEILSAVGRGDTVLIACRGRTCAKIVPVTDGRVAAISLAGMWKDHRKTAAVAAFVSKLRTPRHAD